MDDEYKQFLLLCKDIQFKINLTRKQIKTLRAELDENTYNIEESRLEEFKRIFDRLIVEIDSIKTHVNTEFQKLPETKDDVYRKLK